MGLISFLLIFAIHKWGFVAVYQTPPRYDQTLSTLSTTILLWSVVVHLLFALWQFTNPDMFAQVGTHTADERAANVFVATPHTHSHGAFWTPLRLCHIAEGLREYLCLFVCMRAYCLLQNYLVVLVEEWSNWDLLSLRVEVHQALDNIGDSALLGERLSAALLGFPHLVLLLAIVLIIILWMFVIMPILMLTLALSLIHI